MRVKFSADMVTGRKNVEALNTAPKKDIVFESPHKVYVGNLAWSVRPEDLRGHFSQFGTVVSTRVLYDRKGGKNRVYGFLSFSSADELKAAIETSGSVLCHFLVHLLHTHLNTCQFNPNKTLCLHLIFIPLQFIYTIMFFSLSTK